MYFKQLQYNCQNFLFKSEMVIYTENICTKLNEYCVQHCDNYNQFNHNAGTCQTKILIFFKKIT